MNLRIRAVLLHGFDALRGPGISKDLKPKQAIGMPTSHRMYSPCRAETCAHASARPNEVSNEEEAAHLFVPTPIRTRMEKKQLRMLIRKLRSKVGDKTFTPNLWVIRSQR